MYCVDASYLINRISASNALFRAGSTNRGSGGTLHPVAQLIADPRYDPFTIDFDVAVARVNDNVLIDITFWKHTFQSGFKHA